MAQTLEQLIKAGIAKHQFWFDDYREVPDQKLHCSFCGESILVDYFQFGVTEMGRRLTSFAWEHSKCEPHFVTKSTQMMLTPKEKKGR